MAPGKDSSVAQLKSGAQGNPLIVCGLGLGDSEAGPLMWWIEVFVETCSIHSGRRIKTAPSGSHHRGVMEYHGVIHCTWDLSFCRFLLTRVIETTVLQLFLVLGEVRKSPDFSRRLLG